MSTHRRPPKGQNAGFSLVELLVVISLIAIVAVSFGSFFTNYLILYSKYQQDSLDFSEMTQQSQRLAQVLRGLTDIVSESGNDLTVYAYFSPADAYVSQVHYYLTANNTQLKVDVTPMTANPPNGTLLTAQKKTYTIISNYFQVSGTSLFNYYDANGTLLTPPIADEHSIVQIQINLAEPASHSSKGQTLSMTISLRNRKINL
ncbi:MAG TPA: prepilin-type N-terminal cleavage/methylation domain-containing protein [Verrucomicrobiae bacterium]|nr:prepilin-type N-terminal cleavage/methylation domain-containing protein [Verrucomicrobiae bacterium]